MFSLDFLKLKNLLVLLSCATILAGCQATATGIGSVNTKPQIPNNSSPNQSNPSSSKDALEVLAISYEEAVNLSAEAMNSKYPNQVKVFPGVGITVLSRSFWKGDAEAVITPVIVKDNDSDDYGIIFKSDAKGVGSNFSMTPGYVSNDFFEALGKLIEQRNIDKKVFRNYAELEEKGIVDIVPASIPTSYASFAQYIDNKDQLSPFEGIWDDSLAGDYVLGIYRDNSDPRSPYKAFVIESRKSSWKEGEIKIKFTKLDTSGLAIGKYHLANKAALNVTFKSTPDSLISISPKELANELIYVKTYPRKGETIIGGSGSGWHAGNGIIVTNAHVIEGAHKISVRIGTDLFDAKALTVNQKVDLAILKISSPPADLTVINLREEYEVGERIFAVGYPLGDMLGKTPKITDGIISADEGIMSDPTLFTVSAPIQPGNSGGPLLDRYGNAVGVIVAKLKNQASTDGDVENINYAVKASYLAPLLKNLGIQPSPATKTLENVCREKCSAVVYIETE